MSLHSPIFSILIITYNRHEMLRECLQSILEQTFGDYEVFVIDRGSKPSAEVVITELNDKRFHYIPSSQDIHIADGGNDVIKDINGKYFIHVSDDDLIMKNDLELANIAFEQNSDCDIVQTGLVTYDGSIEYQRVDDVGVSFWNSGTFGSPLFIKYDGKKLAKHTWATSGIGDNINYEPCAYPHPTGMFIRKTAIDKVFERQGGLFLKTFIDAGYHSIAYQTNILYINIPLGIFRVNHAGRASGAGRLRWACEIKNFEYTPLKNVATFWNCSIDASMKCIYRNGIDKKYNTYLRYDFFVGQLQDILKDKPKTLQTFKDAKTVLYYLIQSALKNPLYVLKWHTKDLVELIKNPLKFDKLVIQPIRQKIKENCHKHIDYSKNHKYGHFKSILDYKVFLENKFQNEANDSVKGSY